MQWVPSPVGCSRMTPAATGDSLEKDGNGPDLENERPQCVDFLWPPSSLLRAGMHAHLAVESGPNPRRHRPTGCCPKLGGICSLKPGSDPEGPKLSYWLPQGGEALSTPGLLVLYPQS